MKSLALHKHLHKLAAVVTLALALAGVVALLGQNDDVGRDAWQRPQDVMDALGARAGSVVADIGAGGGYFTFHLAQRVGSGGRVYAVDIDTGELDKIRTKAEEEGLSQVEVVHGDTDDPHLPAGALDAVLIVNAYHEMRQYDAMLEHILTALKPGGKLIIIDGVIEPGDSRETYYLRHRIPREVVRDDAARAGFRFLAEEPGFRRARDKKEFYFLLFENPVS